MLADQASPSAVYVLVKSTENPHNSGFETQAKDHGKGQES